MSATPLLPTSKLENWKYSPVKLLPENFNTVQKKTSFEVKTGETDKLLSWHDTGTEFSNTKINITIGENATLHHWYLLDEGAASVHVDRVCVRIERNGRYVMNALTMGSKWSRSDIHVSLVGEGASCELIGLDIAGGNAQVDRHLLVEHLAPHTSSKQVFKGIFDGEATSSFFGKIKVHHGADGTSATQVNRNLLLSANATANTRPQLEIDTDEVACTHGATVGQLDENAIFFLRSRGLSVEAARSLLTEAFARDVFDAFVPGAEHDDLERRVFAWLKRE